MPDKKDPLSDPQPGDMFRKPGRRSPHSYTVRIRDRAFVGLDRDDGLYVPLMLSNFKLWAKNAEVINHAE